MMVQYVLGSGGYPFFISPPVLSCLLHASILPRLARLVLLNSRVTASIAYVQTMSSAPHAHFARFVYVTQTLIAVTLSLSGSMALRAIFAFSSGFLLYTLTLANTDRPFGTCLGYTATGSSMPGLMSQNRCDFFMGQVDPVWAIVGLGPKRIILIFC